MNFISPNETKGNNPLKSFLEPVPEKKEGLSFIPTQEEYGKQGNMPRNLVQAGLGALKTLTWPADVAQAIAMENMREEERENLIQGNKEGALQAHEQQKNLAENFWTQELGEKKLGEFLGTDLNPQNAEERVSRSFGTLGLSPQALVGAVGEEGLNKMGVPPWLSALIAGGGVAFTSIPKNAKAPKTSTANEVRQVSKKHELPYMKGMEDAPIAGSKAQVSASKHASAEHALKESSVAAVEKIVDKNLPLNKLQKQGVNLEAASESALKITEKRAKQAKNPVYTNEIKDWISKEKATIKNKSPKISDADQKVMKLLDDFDQSFVNPFYSADEMVNQIRAINRNQKSIYKDPIFTGSEAEISQAYGKVKEKVTNAIAKHNPEVASSLQFSNRIYSQRMKLEQTQKLLEPVLENGFSAEKLHKLIQGNKRGYLERNLGKGAVKDLQEIAHYGKLANERVLNNITIAKPLEEQFRGLGLIGSTIFTGKKILGSAASLHRSIQGHIMMSPKLRTDYVSFLKQLSKEAPLKMVQNAADKFEDSIKEEFGSVDALFQLAKADEEYKNKK